MTNPHIPRELVERIKAVTKKRPRTVLQHIVEHGFITTEELRTLYGYDHPPRAARDVREEGIPLETFRVKNAEGRSIGAYRLGDLTAVQAGKLGGRTAFPKAFKQAVVATTDGRCGVCLERYEERYLQVDHRVPYEVAGDARRELKVDAFMPLCGSCNRAKSWSCEHCTNWQTNRSASACGGCYWAHPGSYTHIALRQMRRTEVVWTEGEVPVYESIQEMAESADKSIPDFIKAALARAVANHTAPTRTRKKP